MRHALIFTVLVTLTATTAALAHPLGGGPTALQTAKDEKLTPDQVMDRLRQFHGHLGPYAVLGYRLGDYAVKTLGVNRWFGLSISGAGPTQAPMGCFFDGMQLASGCTFGKGNMKIASASALPAGALYHLDFLANNGTRLVVDVKPSVAPLFASWLQAGEAEEVTFKRTMDTPAADLWTEQRIAPPAPFSDMQIMTDPTPVPAIGDAKNGTMRVVMFGKQFTAMHFLIPPGLKNPPHAGGTPYETPTIITKGKLDLLVADEKGVVQRKTLSAGTLFTWPSSEAAIYGYENPYAEPCEYYTIFAPAFPGVTTPEQGMSWLMWGCPEGGPPKLAGGK